MPRAQHLRRTPYHLFPAVLSDGIAFIVTVPCSQAGERV